MCCSRRRWERRAKMRSQLPTQLAASAVPTAGPGQGTRLEKALRNAALLVLGCVVVFAAYKTSR